MRWKATGFQDQNNSENKVGDVFNPLHSVRPHHGFGYIAISFFCYSFIQRQQGWRFFIFSLWLHEHHLPDTLFPLSIEIRQVRRHYVWLKVLFFKLDAGRQRPVVRFDTSGCPSAKLSAAGFFCFFRIKPPEKRCLSALQSFL